MASAEASRTRHGSVDAVFVAHHRDRDAAGSLLAGALAFRVFLVMLPMLLILIAGLGLGAATGQDMNAAAARIGLTAYAVNIVKEAAGQSVWNHITALSIGSFGLFFASRSLVKALRLVHLLAWHMPVRNFATSAKHGAAAMGFAVGAVAVSVVARAIGSFGALGLLIGLILSLALFFGFWLWVSLLLPRPDGVPWTALVPGAALFAVGGQAIQTFSTYYLVGKAQHFSELYGGLGVAAVLLFWLFLIGRLMIAGAMLNATLWEKRSPEPAVESGEPPGPAR